MEIHSMMLPPPCLSVARVIFCGLYNKVPVEIVTQTLKFVFIRI